MKLHEEVYTSSAELLDGGGGNLGVVARTRGFPPELEGDLSAYRSYTLLDEFPLDAPHLHPPRFAVVVCGRAKPYVLVSQTVFAGADHTGRTRPLCHQVLVACDEIQQAGGSVADLVRTVAPIMYKAWSDPPTWIDPPRAVILPSHQATVDSTAVGTCARRMGFHDEAVISIADALIMFPRTGRAVVISLPPEDSSAALDLAMELLSLLPRTLQVHVPVVTHVVDNGDCPRVAALLFTYPQSPFLAHALRRQDPRKPLLYDANRRLDESAVAKGPYSTTLELAGKPRSTSELAGLTRSWDEWGIGNGDPMLFPRAHQLHERLASAVGAEHIIAASADVEELGRVEGLSVAVERWCQETVERLGRSSRNATWEVLATIHTDVRWPNSTRAGALAVICGCWERALPTLLAHRPPTMSEAQYATLLDAIYAQPNVVERALAGAMHPSTPTAVALAQVTCERMPWNFEHVTQSLTRLRAAEPKLRCTLSGVLLRKAAAHVRRTEEVSAICRLATSQAGDEVYGRLVCELLLHPLAQRAKPGPVLDQLCQLLMETSRASGHLIPELQWLTNSLGREKIGSGLIRKWAKEAGETEHRNITNNDNEEFDFVRARPLRPAALVEQVPLFVPWLFPLCAILALAVAVAFAWAILKPPWTGISSISPSQLSWLAPVFGWLVFEITLRLGFRRRWELHAVGRGIALAAMAACAGGMAYFSGQL